MVNDFENKLMMVDDVKMWLNLMTFEALMIRLMTLNFDVNDFKIWWLG